MDSRLREPKVIFECYIEYIRPKVDEEPKMKYLFPSDYQFDEDTSKNLPKFVFPVKDPNTNAEEHFAFVLTDLEGTFRFGFVRYPAKGDICMCFLTDLPWFKVFYKIMDKIADMQLDYQNEIVEPFLKGLRAHSIPNVESDTVISITPMGLSSGQIYTFPLPNPRRLPEIPTDHNLTKFYPNLHHQVILCFFSNLIFERRIIITSRSLTMLSASVHGAVLFLYPLFWQHIFIPITPLHLIDYCTAPMPFLMGVHSSMMEQVKQMPINDAVILDVDQNELESPYYEDLLQLPPDVTSQLKHVLKKNTSAYGDTATRAFMMAMVAMLGGYRCALKKREADSGVTFDEESFLKSRPHMEDFLSHLLHFQHFQQFINNRIHLLESNKGRDLFDDEVILHEEELKTSKFSSEQMKATLKDMKDMFQKGGTKAVNRTEKFMKYTKNYIQSMKTEKIGPGDYFGTGTLPGNYGTSVDGQKSLTLDGRMLKPGTKVPPRVASYEKHVEGKKRLQQSLEALNIPGREMERINKRLSIIETPFNSILATVPDTPPKNSDDSESASLDSKDSIEVITGNLVDLSIDGHPPRMPTPIIFKPTIDDTDSDSLQSSSSEEIPLPSEVTVNEHSESPPPPIPPPRRGRERNREPFTGNLIDISTESPSIRVTNETSAVTDFTSSIVDALMDGSRGSGYQDMMSRTAHDLSSPSTPSPTPQEFSTHDSRPSNDPWTPVSPNKSLPSNLDALKTGRVSPLTKRVCPPKPPRPYAGSGVTHFLEQRKAFPSDILTPSKVPLTDSTSQKPKDPLGNIFDSFNMQDYALKSTQNGSAAT